MKKAVAKKKRILDPENVIQSNQIRYYNDYDDGDDDNESNQITFTKDVPTHTHTQYITLSMI